MNHLTIGDRLTYFAVWAAVAALGALGVLFSLGPIERHIELSNLRFAWPTVEGRVVSSSARVTHYDETSRTHVQVRFTYKVDGQRFSAEQKWSTFLGASAKDIEKQYSPGTPLTVYYNPSYPSEALIRSSRGWPTGRLLLAIASGLVGILGAAGAFILQFEPAASAGWARGIRGAIEEATEYITLPFLLLFFKRSASKRFDKRVMLENERYMLEYERAEREQKQLRQQLRQDHPELLDAISRILVEHDPYLLVEFDPDYDGSNYETEALYIIPKLAECSASGDVVTVLEVQLDILGTEATAEKIWDAWQEHKNR